MEWLSSLVGSREAEVFTSFAEHVARSAAVCDSSFTEKTMSEIETALRGALDDERVSVSLKGSAAKSTKCMGSDIDLVVFTPGRQISRQDKLAVIEALRKHPLFHKTHLALKKLAIGCIVSHREVDLVFHDTTEFGQLPVGRQLEDGFRDNPIAQHAARILKLAVKMATNANKPERLPSFVIEMLVLEAQRVRQLLPPLSPPATAMHLFLDALQLLADSPDGIVLNGVQARWFDAPTSDDSLENNRVRGQKLGEGRRSSLREFARSVLLLFCAARVYSSTPEGFTTMRDVERWVRCVECGYSSLLPTPLGPVPLWLMGFDGPEDHIVRLQCEEGSWGFSGAHVGDTSRRTLAQCLQLSKTSLVADAFSRGPFAKYTQALADVRKGTSARELAKEAFGGARYEDAVRLYTELLWNDPGDAHLWYSNRSACFTKLGEYARAVRDAAAAVERAPNWPKGHGRILRACLCQYNIDGASRAFQGYRKAVEMASNSNSSANVGDVKLLRSLEKEVAQLRERGPIVRLDATTLSCWRKVLNQDSVLVVDSLGRGDFTSLREALQAASECKMPTSILVTSGTYTLLWPIEVRFEHLQIIGDGEVILTRLSSGHDQPLVYASGGRTRIDLSGLQLIGSALVSSSNQFGHCVYAVMGAHVNLTDCRLRSHVASCAIDKFASATLVRCKADGPGSAILCTDSSVVEARNCQFTGSRVACVEVRSFGCCSLVLCTLQKSELQAIVMYDKAKSVTLTDCKISKCGGPTASALLLEDGTLTVRGCRIVDNAHDGVVVQANSKGTKLDLQFTEVSRNGNCGVAIYGGSATISECRIQENAFGAIFGSQNNGPGECNLGKVVLTRNVLKGNTSGVSGTGLPVAIVGEVELTVENNDADGNGMQVPARSQIKAAMMDAISGRGSVDLKSALEMLPSSSQAECRFFDMQTGIRLTLDAENTFEHELERLAAGARAQTTPLSASGSDLAVVYFQKKALVEMQLRNIEAMESHRKMNTGPQDATDRNVIQLPASASSNKKLSPMQISELHTTLGRRAEGRVLFGTLCAPPARMKGVQLVLADKRGLAVKLSLYNVPGVESSHWRECFPEGLQLGIREPFLKRSADSQLMVRVDHAADLIYTTPVCRTCARAGQLKKECVTCQWKFCNKACEVRHRKGGQKSKCPGKTV